MGRFYKEMAFQLNSSLQHFLKMGGKNKNWILDKKISQRFQNSLHGDLISK